MQYGLDVMIPTLADDDTQDVGLCREHTRGYCRQATAQIKRTSEALTDETSWRLCAFDESAHSDVADRLQHGLGTTFQAIADENKHQKICFLLQSERIGMCVGVENGGVKRVKALSARC